MKDRKVRKIYSLENALEKNICKENDHNKIDLIECIKQITNILLRKKNIAVLFWKFFQLLFAMP